MFKLNLLFFLILYLFLNTNAYATGKGNIAFLKNLDIEELLDVDVSLDDAFDIFDGLVSHKTTSVATGTKQYAERAPAVTTVITAQDIEAMGARSLDEILQSVPGLQVTTNWFNIPVYTLRGISSGYNPEVLVLVNGIRVNDNFSGGKALYWSGFPVSNISRVEVIRGPGSAVYGADAFSGVINIITKTAKEIDGTEAGVRLGSFDTQDTWILHGSEWQGFNITAMLDFAKSDGHQRIVESDAQTVFDGVFGTSASLAPGEYGSELTTYDARFDISKQHWQLRAGFHKADQMGVGTGNAQALDPTKPLNEERTNVDLTYHNPTITDNWDVKAQISYFRSHILGDYQLYPPGTFIGVAYPFGFLGHPSYTEDHTQLNLSGTYRGFNNHQIRTGVGYAYYDLLKVGHVGNFGPNPFTGNDVLPTELLNVSNTFAAYMPEVARKNQYAFIQDTWTITPSWEFTAGVRYDKYSDFGSTTNPRLGLVWEAQSDLIIKLLYGEAFRAPSFQELYNQNNPVSKGNPNLAPETIETKELVFNYRATDNLHLTLNLFHYDIKGKIVLEPLVNSEYSYANAASWKGQGGEFELRWKTSAKSSLLFNYSYQDSEDGSTGATLPNAPRQAMFLRADYLLGYKWYVDTQVNWNDGWKRAFNDARPDLDGYTTVDLVLRRKDIHEGKTNLAFGIRNLFDTDVRYPSPGPDTSGLLNVPNDIPGANRYYFMEFRYKF
ncbi:TonB-dependent receptor [Candidatus Albibeggiatoa sp. nov. BB20]|uniref:TonB-dependent receptor plug domain-containing protein n=1 Tax=Candidatus Albibeggiatoa sp. nov. BB20 TaxID=3162723 RepID=UPI0033654EFC